MPLNKETKPKKRMKESEDVWEDIKTNENRADVIME